MINVDIYNKPLSTQFNSKIVSSSQRIKPKVLIDWLDTRHCSNLSVSTNDVYSETGAGTFAYYFDPKQAFNGFERQSFTWAICNSKDINGKTITADGTWHAVPKDISGNYEFGWWSSYKSNNTVHSSYNGYGFATNPVITASFDSRKCNLIRVFTSEYSGQIDTYRITIRSNDSGVPNPLFSEVVRILDGRYYFDHFLPESVGHSTIYQVEIEILTVKNPSDRARVQEVNIIYQEDMSDYVISYTSDKARDVHESSLPIAGSSSGTVKIDFDNTNKDFNIFGTSSQFGQYMKKDIKMQVTSGWQIFKHEDHEVEKILLQTISSSDLSMSINNTDELPDGGAGNYFILCIDPDKYSKEYVLCSAKSGTYDITIVERGYANTIARSHQIGSKVIFETFEYPAYAEVYVDEWSSSTDSMSVNATATDWSKFLNEKIITDGFFLEKDTVTSAVEKLLMTCNFPKKKIQSLNRFDVDARNMKAILHFDFNESAIDRSGNSISVDNGLRSRFFALPSGSYNKVKDITADALDRNLTQLEKALGETSFVSPSYVANSKDISTNSLCLELGASSGFSFTANNGDSVSEYFNCVFDGFYIPTETGEQYIVVDIANGGVRVYLDDNLILNDWRLHPVSAGSYFTVESGALDLTAGKPYKIRVEAFHYSGDFAITLKYAVGLSPSEDITPSMTKTIAAIDSIGSRNASFMPGDPDRNKQCNYGLYLGGGNVGLTGGMESSEENRAVLFGSSKYLRLPYDISWNLTNSSSANYTGDFTIEILVKPTEVFSNNGEYLSTWVDSGSSSDGFEFYSNASSHGFKIFTTGGYQSVSSNVALSTSDWSHLCVTYSSGSSSLKYYVNGEVSDTLVLSNSLSSWSNLDLTFAGRGAYYDELSSLEVPPSDIRDIYFDEFVLYNTELSSSHIKNRYTEINMKELTIYPFLYGSENSVRQIIDEISLADLGRFYIDELNNARYEHYYKLFEETIDQHANVQSSISDGNSIISADYNVQLQANKVVVKISGISSNLVGVQPLWRAPDPTTLAVVNLESSLTAADTSMYVSTTTDPPFSKAGYLVIDDEIIKYNDTTPNSFLNLERGYFNTTATVHAANTKVREVRYWDLKFDKAPAFQVKNPFITGILFESPDEIQLIRFIPSAYGAELIIAASENVDKGEFVFAEGTNPLTEKVAFTSIAGIPVVVTEQNSQVKEQVANLEDNIRLYGLKEVVIENRFITDFNHGQKIADFIISKMSSPVPILNITTIPTPKIQVGDRIRITELDAFDIINGDYWVMSKNYNYSSNPTQSMVLRKVV